MILYDITYIWNLKIKLVNITKKKQTDVLIVTVKHFEVFIIHLRLCSQQVHSFSS